MFHEQMRADRDNFIQVLWNNIAPTYITQFAVVNSTVNYGVPYNYGSVMHYATQVGHKARIIYEHQMNYLSTICDCNNKSTFYQLIIISAANLWIARFHEISLICSPNLADLLSIILHVSGLNYQQV